MAYRPYAEIHDLRINLPSLFRKLESLEFDMEIYRDYYTCYEEITKIVNKYNLYCGEREGSNGSIYFKGSYWNNEYKLIATFNLYCDGDYLTVGNIKTTPDLRAAIHNVETSGMRF